MNGQKIIDGLREALEPFDAPAGLQSMNDTQAETITRYQRDNDALTKHVAMLQGRVDHSQAYITKIKAENAALKAQLTPEAKADWIFENDISS